MRFLYIPDRMTNEPDRDKLPLELRVSFEMNSRHASSNQTLSEQSRHGRNVSPNNAVT